MENIDAFYKLIKSGLTGPSHVGTSSDKSDYIGLTGKTGMTGYNNHNVSLGHTGPTGPTGSVSPKAKNSVYDECSHKHFLYQ